MDQVLLSRIAIIEAGCVTLTLVSLVAHAIWIGMRRRIAGPQVARAERALRDVLEGEAPIWGDLSTLIQLPRSAQIEIFSELSTNLRGSQQEELRALADDVGLLGQAERWCASRRWFKRLRGARVMTLLGAGGMEIGALMDDRRPEVRAQAAQWAADHPDAEVVDRLLAMLTDPARLCRFTVEDSLRRVGLAAVPGLLRQLAESEGSSLESALDIATGIADPRFLGPALALCRAPDPRVRALAAALAAAIGGAQVSDTLTGLLADRDAGVRAAAAHGLGKLAHWPAGAALAERLRDSSWDVRRAAALALVACGATGILLLRRALLDRDRFARDMARQVLGAHEAGRRPQGRGTALPVQAAS
ncbi:MAG: HEAT repeat domain-containing protein [Actinomycetota bacterium]|nr:HEAT repeat domain-containing protein [Actinomycetota bacterium]